MVRNSPYGTSNAAYETWQQCQDLLVQGQHVEAIFFFQDGVLNASRLNHPPEDEFNLTPAWQQLAKQHNVELLVCVASALRRGIIDEDNARFHNITGSNLADGFTIAGLTRWIELCQHMGKRTFTFIFTAPPYSKPSSQETFEFIQACGALDCTTRLVFLDKAIQYLQAHDAPSYQSKHYTKLLNGLEHFGIEEVYVHETDLAATTHPKATSLSQIELAQLLIDDESFIFYD